MTSVVGVVLQDGSSAAANAFGAMFSGTVLLFIAAVGVVFIVGMWKVFAKAGHPGWFVLIPIFNAYIMLKIAGRPGWWLLLYFVPIVNVVVAALIAMDIAKSFGQSAAFGIILLFLLGGIGYLILGFGSARYLGPAAAPKAMGIAA